MILFNLPQSHTHHVIFVKVNTGLLTLLDAATKVMQDEMIKNVSNIENYRTIIMQTGKKSLCEFLNTNQSCNKETG